MASGENVLWAVWKEHINEIKKDQCFIFRTRKAANDFKKVQKSSAYNYRLRRATWGPEQ